MPNLQPARTLQEQFRDVQRQMSDFVKDGDVTQEQADRILEDLRKGIKALRAGRS